MPLLARSRPSISRAPVLRSPSRSARAGIQRKRILIIEDELPLSEMLCIEISASEMVPVGPASRLDEALKLANEARIDAALVDVDLGDGIVSFPVCDVLTRRSIPFLFVTGTRDRIPAKFSAAAVVEKPYWPADLMAALTLLL
jgi:DNA-binding response OmpR family regulator